MDEPSLVVCQVRVIILGPRLGTTDLVVRRKGSTKVHHPTKVVSDTVVPTWIRERFNFNIYPNRNPGMRVKGGKSWRRTV